MGEIMIRGFVVILLTLFSALTFDASLLAKNKNAGAQSKQTPRGPRMGQSAAVKTSSPKQRRATKRNKCMPQSSPESTKPDERQTPTMDAPPLILDPTDREPGPPKEIVPKHIDPAEMPAIKPPRKKKKINPQ